MKFIPLLLSTLLLCAARVDAQPNPCTAPNVDVTNPVRIAMQSTDLPLTTVAGVTFSVITKANSTILTNVSLPKAAFVLAPGTTDCWITPVNITPLFERNGTVYEMSARLIGAEGVPDSPSSDASNGFSFTAPRPTAPTALRIIP